MVHPFVFSAYRQRPNPGNRIGALVPGVVDLGPTVCVNLKKVLHNVRICIHHMYHPGRAKAGAVASVMHIECTHRVPGCKYYYRALRPQRSSAGALSLLHCSRKMVTRSIAAMPKTCPATTAHLSCFPQPTYIASNTLSAFVAYTVFLSLVTILRRHCQLQKPGG